MLSLSRDTLPCNITRKAGNSSPKGKQDVGSTKGGQLMILIRYGSLKEQKNFLACQILGIKLEKSRLFVVEIVAIHLLFDEANYFSLSFARVQFKRQAEVLILIIPSRDFRDSRQDPASTSRQHNFGFRAQGIKFDCKGNGYPSGYPWGGTRR